MLIGRRRGLAIRACVVGLCVGLAGSALLFKDLIPVGTSDVLWGDDFDSRLVYWIVNWGHHGLCDRASSPGFWNANSFYPHSNTLAYSESLLGMQLFFAPLRAIGVPPLTSLYLALGAVCVLSAAMTARALDRAGGFSLPEAALVAFCAHFGLSMTSFFIHYQLFGFQLAVPFFLHTYLFVRDLRRGDLVLACLLFIEGVCFSMYLAPMLLLLVLLAALPALLRQVRGRGLIGLARRVGVSAPLIVALSAGLLYLVQLRPYFDAGTVRTKQSLEQTAVYSAGFGSVFTTTSAFSDWYSRGGYAYGEWEYAYFPGYGLVAMSASWVLLTALRRARRTAVAEERQAESCGVGPDEPAGLRTARRLDPGLLVFMGILLASCLALSWGPYHKSDHGIRLPFYYVSQVVWGIDSIRAPGRFGMFIGLPLAVFAVAGLRLVNLGKRPRLFLTCGVLLLLVVDSLQTFPTYPFSLDESGVYSRVAEAIEPGTPLLEMPVFGWDHYDTLLLAMRQLDGSTLHWGRLVVGYGAQTTEEYSTLLALDQSIQAHAAAPSQAVDYGIGLGIAHYLIHFDRYDDTVRQGWRAASRRADALVLIDDDSTLFFRVGETQ